MLTDAQIKRAKGMEKPYKLSDTGGLFLHVAPSGARSWRQKYRYGGKEKLLTHGLYPQTTLSAARELRDAAKKALREGRDPA